MARSKASKPGSKPRLKPAPPAAHPSSTNGSQHPGNAQQKETAPSPELNGKAAPASVAAGASAVAHAAELAEKIKELVRLAQEQGYLTYGDINDALPETLITPEDLDVIYIKLRGLEVEIVDQAEVDRIKQPETEEADEKSRLDILDDPVRMYLKQMGQVPLLTREQEVEISKRIEAAEAEVKDVVYNLGFTGKEHIALAEKLLADPPRERFDRVVLDIIESR